MAVGRLRATSRAKVGPETTATGTSEPRYSRTTSCSGLAVSGSRPFVAQATRDPGRSAGRTSSSTWAKN